MEHDIDRWRGASDRGRLDGNITVAWGSLTLLMHSGRIMNTRSIATAICLVRHGETSWNANERTQGSTDIPLNDTGRVQALTTAGALETETWDAVISSPLSRAVETAEIIAAKLGVAEVQIDAALVERNYGAAEGVAIEEQDRRFPDKRIPGAEEWEDVEQRVLYALQRIARSYLGQRVIVVGHGAAIMAVLARLTGGAVSGKNARLKNASMNWLVYDGHLRVTAFNRTADDIMKAREHRTETPG